jgi:serine/threonine-protein kinase
LRDLEVSLALKRKVLPPDHPDIAISLISMADSQEELGDFAAALRWTEQGLDLYRRAYGAGSPLLGHPLSNRGELLNRLGRNEEAERDLRESVERWSGWLGPAHPWMGYPLTALGKTLIDLRRPREAVPVLERALRIRDGSEPNQELVAETRFALAHARFEAGENRSGALALAESARDAYRKIPGQAKHAREVEAWLAANAAAKRPGSP